MILRPVTPASADGPPWLKSPVGFTYSVTSLRHHDAEHARPELLADVFGDLLLIGVGRVLRRDDDRGDFLRLVVLVEDGDLRLAVGTEEVDLALPCDRR